MKQDFVISQEQDDILHGKLCPYCKSKPKYVDSSAVYGSSYGMIYICFSCDAYCGVHKGTDNALGRLANKELRYWKREAHRYFDKIWKEKYLTRTQAYTWLSEILGTPKEYTHIGMFSVKTCKEVVYLCKQQLNDLRRLDMEFGVEVNRPHKEA